MTVELTIENFERPSQYSTTAKADVAAVADAGESGAALAADSTADHHATVAGDCTGTATAM